jgi:predicted transglutaminase-like cysteine proteinase
MIKTILNSKRFKNFLSLSNVPSENHVESFNLLQCDNIRQAPSSAFTPCGAAQKNLGSPATLFPFSSRKEKGAGRAEPNQTQSWLKLIKTMSQFGAKGQIAGINNFINGRKNVTSIAAYGKAKNWTTPAHFFRCEDHSENYAIAKYLSLRLLGFHGDRLRVVWLRTKGRKSQHAVLMVKIADQTFVLDSRCNNITTDDMLLKEQPICSLNGNHFIVHWNAKTPNGAIKAVKHLTQYAKLNSRLFTNLNASPKSGLKTKLKSGQISNSKNLPAAA